MKRASLILTSVLALALISSCKSKKNYAGSGGNGKNIQTDKVDPNCPPTQFVFEHLSDRNLKGLKGQEHKKQDFIFKDIYHYSYEPVPEATFPNTTEATISNFPGGIGWQYAIYFDKGFNIESLVKSMSACGHSCL